VLAAGLVAVSVVELVPDWAADSVVGLAAATVDKSVAVMVVVKAPVLVAGSAVGSVVVSVVDWDADLAAVSVVDLVAEWAAYWDAIRLIRSE